MKETTIKFYGKDLKVRVQLDRRNNYMNVQAYCFEEDGQYWEPFATLNVSNGVILAPVAGKPNAVQFIAKTYSENAGICESLINKGILEDTEKRHYVGGFVGNLPILLFEDAS